MTGKKDETTVAEATVLQDEMADEIAAQVKEYSQFVAVQPIYVGNALAYNTGDPVPASNVERHGYEAKEWVKRVS